MYRVLLRFVFVILLLCFSITPCAFAFSVKAGYKVGTYPSASTSPNNTKQLDANIKHGLISRKQPDLLAVYKQKDVVWSTAQKILKKIADGEITINNLNKITYPKERKVFNSHKTAVKYVLSLIRSKKRLINSKHLTDPKVKGNKGVIIMEKYSSQPTVVAAVFFFLKKPVNGSFKAVELTFRSSKPYKNWMLSGIHLKDQIHISW